MSFNFQKKKKGMGEYGRFWLLMVSEINNKNITCLYYKFKRTRILNKHSWKYLTGC